MRHLEPIVAILLCAFTAPPIQSERSAESRPAPQGVPGVPRVQADQSPVKDFERLCEYLGAESGVWLQANPNRDTAAPNRPDAFDLTFACDDARRVLTMEIGSRYRDGTRRVGWRAVWFWHPGRQETVYLAYARGSVIEGVTEFTEDDVFVTTYVRYESDGTPSRGRDENTVLSARQHRVTAYSFEDGAWHPKRSVLLHLQPSETGNSADGSPAVRD